MGQEPDLVDRLAAAAMEVKELLSDLHTVQKSLRRDIGAGRVMIRDLNNAKQRFIEQSIEEEVLRQFDILNKEIAEEMAKAVAKVNAQFEKLADILMGRTAGGIPLETLVKKAYIDGEIS